MRKITAGIFIFLISITLCSCDVSILPGFLPRVKGNIKEDNLKLGIYHLKKGKIDKAIRKFTMSTNAYPDYAPGYFYLAVAYEQKRRPIQDQIKLYEKAIELDPKMYGAYNNAGQLYFEQNNFGKAEAYYKKVLSIKSDYLITYVNLGSLYLENKQYSDAENILKKALEIDSNNPFIFYSLGLAYEKMNRIEDAIFYLQKAISLSQEPELINNAKSIITRLKNKQK